MAYWHRAALVALLAGCGDGVDDAPPTDDDASAGGAIDPGSTGGAASGGQLSATGGADGTGGNGLTGGATATGGAIATGGNGVTGGATATGGGSATGGSAEIGGFWPIDGGDGTDDVPPSVEPPGGLSRDETPMFVVFGFDDNAYADGALWARDLFHALRNPDGTMARATFFLTGSFASDNAVVAGGQTTDDVLDAWLALIEDGHEVANHTWTHAHGSGQALPWWQDEVTADQEFLVTTLGVPAAQVLGFRTPFLEYGTATFEALEGAGLRYDCSIEFGYDWWQHDPDDYTTGHSPGSAETGKWYPWPYTLDDGSPPGSSDKGAGERPGMWEFPVYTYNRPTGETTVATVTGFDFNVFKSLSAADALTTLKYSFDQRLAGNRSPFFFGGHSDYYSAYNATVNEPGEFVETDYEVRRQVVEEFLAYVLTHDEVRVVPAGAVLTWMRDPTPLP